MLLADKPYSSKKGIRKIGTLGELTYAKIHHQKDPSPIGLQQSSWLIQIKNPLKRRGMKVISKEKLKRKKDRPKVHSHLKIKAVLPLFFNTSYIRK